jgi:D-ribose pyranose/furanose isomerase RbsD
MTGYIDRRNRRYGIVRSMRSVQDEINRRRSRALALLNQRQTMSIKGSVSVATLKREMAAPDGHIEVDPDVAMAAREMGVPAFQVLPTSDMAQGNLAMLQEAKSEIDQLGPNASLLGQQQGQQSGRAIMAQQQAGMAELAPLYDSLRDFTLRCYRAIWSRVRQYWTDERYIRITSDMQAPQWLTVNEVVGFDPFTMQPMVQNRVAEMDVDIIIDEAPDHVTLQAEQFEQLSAMAQAGLPIPPEVLIEASSLRDKPKLLEMMQQAKQEAMMQQQAMAQAQAQSAQAAAQLQQIDVASKADERAATAEQKRTDTALKVAGAMGGAMMPPAAAGF